VACAIRVHGLFGATGLTVAQPVPNTVCRFKLNFSALDCILNVSRLRR